MKFTIVNADKDQWPTSTTNMLYPNINAHAVMEVIKAN